MTFIVRVSCSAYIKSVSNAEIVRVNYFKVQVIGTICLGGGIVKS